MPGIQVCLEGSENVLYNFGGKVLVVLGNRDGEACVEVGLEWDRPYCFGEDLGEVLRLSQQYASVTGVALGEVFVDDDLTQFLEVPPLQGDALVSGKDYKLVCPALGPGLGLQVLLHCLPSL